MVILIPYLSNTRYNIISCLQLCMLSRPLFGIFLCIHQITRDFGWIHFFAREYFSTDIQSLRVLVVVVVVVPGMFFVRVLAKTRHTWPLLLLAKISYNTLKRSTNWPDWHCDWLVWSRKGQVYLILPALSSFGLIWILLSFLTTLSVCLQSLLDTLRVMCRNSTARIYA